MNKITEQKYVGERSLFQARFLELDHCTFEDGESPLKESRDIKLSHVHFKWKYPL